MEGSLSPLPRLRIENNVLYKSTLLDLSLDCNRSVLPLNDESTILLACNSCMLSAENLDFNSFSSLPNAHIPSWMINSALVLFSHRSNPISSAFISDSLDKYGLISLSISMLLLIIEEEVYNRKLKNSNNNCSSTEDDFLSRV